MDQGFAPVLSSELIFSSRTCRTVVVSARGPQTPTYQPERPLLFTLAGVSNLLVSLGHTGRGRVVLGHTLNIQTLTKTDEQKKILSKFMILCWAVVIAILGCRLDTPGSIMLQPTKPPSQGVLHVFDEKNLNNLSQK